MWPDSRLYIAGGEKTFLLQNIFFLIPGVYAFFDCIFCDGFAQWQQGVAGVTGHFSVFGLFSLPKLLGRCHLCLCCLFGIYLTSPKIDFFNLYKLRSRAIVTQISRTDHRWVAAFVEMKKNDQMFDHVLFSNNNLCHIIAHVTMFFVSELLLASRI